MPCAHFVPEQPCCALGVNYQQLAGGGVFSMVMRLPCLPISNRRGDQAQVCKQYKQSETTTED